MFRRKKQEESGNQVENSRRKAYDFRLRGRYNDYRPSEYRMYSELEEEVMKPRLDAFLDRLLEHADEFNSEMLDNFLLGIGLEAISNLAEQRAGHEDVIRDLAVRHRNDRADIANKVAEAEREVAEAQKAFDRVDGLARRFYPDRLFEERSDN